MNTCNFSFVAWRVTCSRYHTWGSNQTFCFSSYCLISYYCNVCGDHTPNDHISCKKYNMTPKLSSLDDFIWCGSLSCMQNHSSMILPLIYLQNLLKKLKFVRITLKWLLINVKNIIWLSYRHHSPTLGTYVYPEIKMK